MAKITVDTSGLYNKFDVFSKRTGEKVEAFTFTLVPDRDPHAEVALAAYADSVRVINPTLASDINDLLSELARARRGTTS